MRLTATVSPQCAVIRRSASVDFSELRHQKIRAQCVLCLGRACRRCGELAWKLQGGKSAIAGLHSNWIVDRVLAMQRPSSRAIVTHGLLESFNHCGIGAIFNLQEPGEHAACGDGILQGGFSYAPEELMARGIRFYLFSWRDLKTPTSSTMLNCVKVMAGELERGVAIAVHCHAGLGRTGVAIACLLVYLVAADPTAAIALVRKRRPGSVQKRKQEIFVERFAARVAALRTVWPTAAPAEVGALTLDEVLERQYELLHGAHAQRLRTTPQVVLACCTRLEALAPDAAAAEEVGLALACAAELAPVGDAAAEAAASSALSEALVADADAEASGLALALAAVPTPNDEGSPACSAPSKLRASLDAAHDGLYRLRDEAAASAAATVLVEWLEALRAPVLPAEVRDHLAARIAVPLLVDVAALSLPALLEATLSSAGAASTAARVARMLRRVRERGCLAATFDVACARVGAALCGGDDGNDCNSDPGALIAALVERADSGAVEPELSPPPHFAAAWAAPPRRADDRRHAVRGGGAARGPRRGGREGGDLRWSLGV